MSLSEPYGVGLRNVGSYQVSGQPYLSGAVTSTTHGSVYNSRFNFPYVSKKIILTNKDEYNSAIVSFVPYLETESTALGYTSWASGSGNWLYLSSGSTMELNVKCEEIFVSTYEGHSAAVDYVQVYAELTNISVSSMYSLDGLEGSGE